MNWVEPTCPGTVADWRGGKDACSVACPLRVVPDTP